MNEYWRPVVGYEGIYEVSNVGRVRALEKVVRARYGTRKVAAKTLKLIPVQAGYTAVNLWRAGASKMTYVHVLVLEAFVGPRPTLAHVCRHWDDKKANNHLGNLLWGTEKENAQDKMRNGNGNEGEKCWSAKITAAQAAAIRKDSRTHKQIAQEVGLARQTIGKIKAHRTWRSVGDHQNPPEAPPGD